MTDNSPASASSEKSYAQMAGEYAYAAYETITGFVSDFVTGVCSARTGYLEEARQKEEARILERAREIAARSVGT